MPKTGFFGRFNRGFARTAKGYEGWLAAAARAGGSLVIYAAIVGPLRCTCACPPRSCPTKTRATCW